MSEAERLREVIAAIRRNIARSEHRIAALEAIDVAAMTTDDIIATVSDPETFSLDLDIVRDGATGRWRIGEPLFGAERTYPTFHDALVACIAAEIAAARADLEDERRELRDLGVDA